MIDILMLAYMTLLGAALGSFVNVVIARLPEGASIVRPRSRCPGCAQPIAWYDNIPLLSWILLRGRCRRCGMRIAFRYPLVELLMAALSAALWVRFGFGFELLIWLPLSVGLLAIVFLDIDYWWVPDVITFPSLGFAALASFLPGGLTPLGALLGILPALFALAIAWGFAKATGKEGLGLGDVKLLAVIGVALGAFGGLNVLVLAAMQGAVVGVIVQLTGGHKSKDQTAADEAPALGAAVTAGPSAAATCDGESASLTARDEAPAAKTGEDDVATTRGEPDTSEDDEWTPPPRAIPFGPFLILATWQVLLVPELFADLLGRLSLLMMRGLG